MGRVVHGASCPWGELSMGRVFPGASCPWGELSLGRVVYGASCPGASFDRASCPWGELSWGEWSGNLSDSILCRTPQQDTQQDTDEPKQNSQISNRLQIAYPIDGKSV